MEDFIKMIAEALLPIVGALLTALSTYAVSLIAKRLKLRLSEEEMIFVRAHLRKAVAGAEEWAARKAKLESKPVAGASKALWVHERMKEMFPNLTSDQLDKLIDEELATLSDIGATGSRKVEI